jgi:hydrogenase maturation protein HypF
MIDFPLCNTCNTGYTDPFDRRYHAQTTACFDCGPRYQLLDSEGEIVKTKDVVRTSSQVLKKGSVLAIQGISGTHLVTLTSRAEPITTLRKRKHREQRPFAVMVRDESAIESISRPTEFEMNLLKSWKRPIVLVRKKLDLDVHFEHELVSPGLDTIGIMLPYAPLHHLFFRNLDETALVMTSANPTGVPMYIDPDTIVSSLGSVADFFLVHNRRIHQRADDSVIKILRNDNPVFIRKARGYIPEPMRVNVPKHSLKILGLGPEEKVTGSILHNNHIYQTQHIGDIDRIETADFLLDAINHMVELLGISEFDGISCDLHPEFVTTDIGKRMANEKEIPLHRVQHHHAHLASLMGEHSIDYDTNITCITVDGFGYGSDGKAWGGEILTGNLLDFERRGGLKPVMLPGGDLSARYASRSLLGILRNDIELEDIIKIVKGHPVSPDKVANSKIIYLIEDSIVKGVNTMESTSAGRFLDAASLVLGVAVENSYDAECPMKLEAVAKKTELSIESEYSIIDGERFLDTSRMLSKLIELKKQGVPRSQLAYLIQYQLGSSLAEIACEVAMKEEMKYVGISGGVALNRIITSAVIDVIEESGLRPLVHREIPPGDGGVSVGQALVAAARTV